jgi:hypothetical protein
VEEQQKQFEAEANSDAVKMAVPDASLGWAQRLWKYHSLPFLPRALDNQCVEDVLIARYGAAEAIFAAVFDCLLSAKREMKLGEGGVSLRSCASIKVAFSNQRVFCHSHVLRSCWAGYQSVFRYAGKPHGVLHT